MAKDTSSLASKQKSTAPTEELSADQSTKKTTKVSKGATKAERSARGSKNPFRAIGGYFKGAWQELRQVHWTNRPATWSLTLAVILFSIFFAALILGLDSAFSYLFKEILL